MKPKLGWRKDRFDLRDFIHPKPMVMRLEPEVKLDKWLPDIRNQGSEGSCVGHGIGANLTAMAKKQNVFTQWFSPRWIYNGARYIEGMLNYDEGCYPKDALDWLRKKGCLLESYWPYVEKHDISKSPPSSLDSYAAVYPIVSYYRVTNGVTGICSALMEGYYVSIGTPWFDKWMAPPKTGNLQSVKKTDSVAGGHETCLYGYHYEKQVFYGFNSWGSDWGAKGFFTMPFKAFDVFKDLGGYDAHYIKTEWKQAEPVQDKQDIKVSVLLDGKTITFEGRI